MSDGPHRSLEMRRSWKKLAERADKNVFTQEDVREALEVALERDWRVEVPEILNRRVESILHDTQISFFENQVVKQLEALRGVAAGYPLGGMFLDYAIQAAEKGLTGDDGLKVACCNALEDRAMRRVRQVEEHYLRRSKQCRATHVRKRIQDTVIQSDFEAIADICLQMNKSENLRGLVRHTGLDDGVQL